MNISLVKGGNLVASIILSVFRMPIMLIELPPSDVFSCVAIDVSIMLRRLKLACDMIYLASL